MRIGHNVDGHVTLIMEHTGDVAKMLTVFQYYNNQIPRESFKPIPRNITDTLEDELVQE